MIESDKDLTFQIQTIDGATLWAEADPESLNGDLTLEIGDEVIWLSLDQAKALKDFINKVLRRAKEQGK